MSRVLRVVLQHLDSPIFAVLRTHPPDYRDEERNALCACRIRSGEREIARDFQECIDDGAAARASFMRNSGNR